VVHAGARHVTSWSFPYRRPTVTPAPHGVTWSPMHLMTTAAPRVGRGAFDGFETVTLSAGELEAASAPGAGMAVVSMRHAGAELLDRQADLRTYVERGRRDGDPDPSPLGQPSAGPRLRRRRADRSAPGRPAVCAPGARFVCFEPMTAPTNALRSGDGLRRVLPGRWFTGVFRIAVAAE
jgi:hypothetical protein